MTGVENPIAATKDNRTKSFTTSEVRSKDSRSKDSLAEVKIVTKQDSSHRSDISNASQLQSFLYDQVAAYLESKRKQ